MTGLTHILEVNKISKTFTQGGPAVLSEMSFGLAQGQVICLVGPSGGGKTTLLRCLAGLEKVDNGLITMLGRKISSKPRSDVAYVFQDYTLWPDKTVLENILLAPVLVKKQSREEATEIAEQLLKKFSLLDKRHDYPRSLSGGQRQRVAIIRALAMQPKILLLDEITSALDPELVAGVLNVIKVLAKEGQSMVIATHHVRFATEVADKILFLENGTIIQESNARDFIYAQKNSRIQDFVHALGFGQQEINVYEGADQFQAFQLGTLKRFREGSSKNVVGSSGDRWFEVMGKYYDIYERQRVQKGIIWKMIMYSESPLDRDVRLRYPSLNEYRLLPKNVENPANYYVIEDVVVVQIFGKPDEEPAIIEIKNGNVAKSYQNYFNLIWEQSTPVV
jgi:ABC-type polar amino acid transport system ATPase subunit